MNIYIRGITPLGLFNTVIQFMGIVLVIVKDDESGKSVDRYFDKARNHPSTSTKEV